MSSYAGRLEACILACAFINVPTICVGAAKVLAILRSVLSARFSLVCVLKYQSKEDCKDQELIHSNTTPDPGNHMGK